MHLHIRNNTYVYRRRIPKQLKPLISVTEFKRALCADKRLSKQMASKYDLMFSQLEAALHLDLDISSILDAINGPVEVFAPPEIDMYEEFLSTKKDIAAGPYREYERQIAIFRLLLPKDLKDLTYRDLDALKDSLANLPKLNIQKYRKMDLNNILKTAVPVKDRISIKSQNEYLKTLKAVLKLGTDRGYLTTQLDIKLLKNTVSARNQKQVLSSEEIALLMSSEDIRISSIIKLSYFSGMRLSEIYKCKLVTVDNIRCFDLRDTTIELKNEHSHRLIPVHSAIENEVDTLMASAVSMSGNWHTRKVSQLLGGGTKTLYSLRHTFATSLAQNIDMNILSELMGHAHKSMTAGRYVKGFNTRILKQNIEELLSTDQRN